MAAPGWLFLGLAILAETAGTTLLKASEQFTRLVPAVACVVCYGASLYCLGLCLKTIPLGVAYAVWSAAGIALIVASGALFFGQKPDFWTVVGLLLIVGGVAVVYLLGKTPTR